MGKKEYPRICGNCKYFDDKRFVIGFNGMCKRRPETVNKTADDWCGEFAILPEPKIWEVQHD